MLEGNLEYSKFPGRFPMLGRLVGMSCQQLKQISGNTRIQPIQAIARKYKLLTELSIWKSHNLKVFSSWLRGKICMTFVTSPSSWLSFLSAQSLWKGHYPSAQLVHQCSWQRWIRSSLAYSSESVKIWRSWKWGGHWGHDGFFSINIHIPYFFLSKLHVRSLLGLCVPSVTWRSKRPLKRPFHTT